MKKLLSRILPGDVILKRANRRIIMNFAENVGMVYFGHVDSREEEHQLIRGLTLSTSHRDDHYSVGSLYKYDVALVERTDTLHYPGKPSQTHHWLIMQFDLHTTADIPHVFLGLHTQGATFYANLFAKFAQLQRAPLGTFGMYDESFTNKYAIYTTPAESLTVERLFDTEMTKTLAKHFGALTVEIGDGCLYLYSEHNRVSKNLLDAMLQNGIWLARHIDDRAEVI